MILDRVTITGADDRTDPAALARLSARHPFVEWGILISEVSSGSPRHPSPEWRRRLAEAAAQGGLRLAAHLEGSLSLRTMIEGSDEFFAGPYHAQIFARIQLNGFSRVAEAARTDSIARHPAHTFIFQVESDEAYALAARHGAPGAARRRRNGPGPSSISGPASPAASVPARSTRSARRSGLFPSARSGSTWRRTSAPTTSSTSPRSSASSRKRAAGFVEHRPPGGYSQELKLKVTAVLECSAGCWGGHARARGIKLEA